MLSYGRSKLSNGNSNAIETNGISRNYKPASRSNSNNLFPNSENSGINGDVSMSNGVPSRFSKVSLGSSANPSSFSTSNTSSIPTSPTSPQTKSDHTNSFNTRSSRDERVSQASTDLEKRIQETLAKHGVEGSQNKNSNSYETPNYHLSSISAGDRSSDRSVSNNRHVSISENVNEDIDTSNMYGSSWRRRLDAEDVTTISVISCSTSPNPDSTKQVRTRIARSTEPIIREIRTSRKKRTYTAACQTDYLDEFGTLKDHLEEEAEKLRQSKRIIPSASFDYFARVQQSLQDATSEKIYSEKVDNPQEEDEDYFEIKRAPMTSLLPGNRENTISPRPSRFKA